MRAVQEIAGTTGTGELAVHELRAPMGDGVELFYRAWEPTGAGVSDDTPRRAVVIFHRGHEHSGRLDELVRSLDLPGTWFFAWDQRGHGHSPGERGHAESFGRVIHDADAFVRFVCGRHGINIHDVVVIGHSVGAVIASAWAHDFAPPIRGMALVTPALRIKLYVPLAIPGLRLLNAVKKKAFIKSYVKPGMLTHDAEQAAKYAADPLISRNIAVNILLGVHDTSTRILKDAGAIRTPTLVLSAGSDWVVHRGVQEEFTRALGSSVKEYETYPGFHHAVLHEKERARPIARIRVFIGACFAREPVKSAEILARPHAGGAPEPGVFQKIGFAVSRGFLKTFGKLSEGIAIGWRSGFDSGQSLDHVYRNTAKGVTPLGRLIDRFYLDAPGWQGIRTRKKSMERLLEQAATQTLAAGKPVRILDIAAGPGRYVMDAIKRHPEWNASAVLRDRDQGGLAEGRAISAEYGLTSVKHEPGDAFDPASIASASPRPTIGIVSGLYELFPDNALIERSLRGIHDAIEEGGMLLYTNQPWHPQLAFIAHTLINRDKVPWVMRCRSQAEMDALVRAAGFEKVESLTDEQGIFTVSLARKVKR